MKNNLVIKSGIWYTISNFLVGGIGFITTPIFTRLLTQEEFGAFNNFTSWVSILGVIVALNMESTLISARYEYEDRLDEYIFSILSLSMISTICWWGLVNVFMDQAVGFFEMNPVYINGMFVYLLTQPAIKVFQARESFFYRYKVSATLSILLSVGASLFSVLLVVTMSNRLDGRVYGMILPNILIGAILMLYFVIAGKKLNIGYWKYALKIALPFIPHLLSLTFLNMIDRIMITKICGEKAVALYSIGYTVALIITILLQSLNGAIAPWIGENLAKKQYESIRETSKVYILLFMYLAIGIMLVSPEILLVMGGASYIDAKWIMIPISLGCVCQFLYSLFVNVEQFEKKTVGMAVASVSAAVLNFVLNAWLIPIYGYVAAAYTTLAGYLWLLLVHMYLVYKYKMSQVYSYRFVALSLIVVSIIAIFINLLYVWNWIRYLVLAVYILATLLIGWKNKDKIIGFVKK